MDALGPWHLLIIAGFFVLLFGAKKLPDAARSLGRSARIMKSELKGLHEEPKVTEQPVAEGPIASVRPAEGPVADGFVRPLEPIHPAVADELSVAVQHDGAR